MKKIKLDILKQLLSHEKNNPIEAIKLKSDYTMSLAHFLNTHYCCFGTGWGRPDPGTLEDQEKKLLSRIKTKESVWIKTKYDTLESFRRAFKREMHWINQMTIRQTRFKEITKKIFIKVEKNISIIGSLEKYVENNFDTLIKGLPVSKDQIVLESKSKIQILELVRKGEVSPKAAQIFLDKIDDKEKELTANKLCPFSGSGNDPDIATSICSRTGDPKKLGNCGSCRVASEWEEAYG